MLIPNKKFYLDSEDHVNREYQIVVILNSSKIHEVFDLQIKWFQNQNQAKAAVFGKKFIYNKFGCRLRVLVSKEWEILGFRDGYNSELLNIERENFVIKNQKLANLNYRVYEHSMILEVELSDIFKHTDFFTQKERHQILDDHIELLKFMIPKSKQA